MVKKRRGKHGTPHRTATRRSEPRHRDPGHDPETQKALSDFREALRADDPLEFVALISSAIELFTQAAEDPELWEAMGDVGYLKDGRDAEFVADVLDIEGLEGLEGLDEGPADLEGASAHTELPVTLAFFVEAFLHIDVAETTAALTVFAALLTDDVMAARIRRELAHRRQPMPRNIADIAEVAADAAYLMGDEFGDVENVLLGYTWPDGRRQSAVVYVDHNLGGPYGVSTDGFLLDQPIEELLETYHELMREYGADDELVPLDPAEARVRIEGALAASADMPLLTDDDEELDEQWPLCRPFLSFLASRLPEADREGQDWASRAGSTPETAAEAMAGFLASPYGEGVGDDPIRRGAVELLFATAERCVGDPLRWSPGSIEIVLMGELLWDEEATPETLDAVPDVAEPVVRYALDRGGFSAAGQTVALEALGGWLSEYTLVRTMEDPGELRRSNAAIEALLAGNATSFVRRLLLEHVGSEAALDALGAEPLPAEGFDLEAVPAEIRDRVADVVTHLDRFVAAHAEQGFDTEFRTAAYRFLAAVTAGETDSWRRTRRTDAAAAAVIWAVGRANELVGVQAGALPIKELQAFYGLTSSPSQRARPMLEAVGVNPDRASYEVGLGNPAYLTSPIRARLIASRDGSPLPGES